MMGKPKGRCAAFPEQARCSALRVAVTAQDAMGQSGPIVSRTLRVPQLPMPAAGPAACGSPARDRPPASS